MKVWQNIFLLAYGLGGIIGTWIGYKKCRIEKNNLGLVGGFVIYGAFVWADIVIFGPFWFLFSLLSLYLRDFTLFLLGLSVFWVVRSIGETIYWFNQQFSDINRNPKSTFFFSKIFHNDVYTDWFVMQIIFQCIAVVSIILSLYYGKLWLSRF